MGSSKVKNTKNNAIYFQALLLAEMLDPHWKQGGNKLGGPSRFLLAVVGRSKAICIK